MGSSATYQKRAPKGPLRAVVSAGRLEQVQAAHRKSIPHEVTREGVIRLGVRNRLRARLRLRLSCGLLCRGLLLSGSCLVRLAALRHGALAGAGATRNRTSRRGAVLDAALRCA